MKACILVLATLLVACDGDIGAVGGDNDVDPGKVGDPGAALPGTVTVSLAQTVYNYDLGTPNSPVHPGFVRISPSTVGDIYFNRGPVHSRDRGSASGANANNRDFIFGSGLSIFNHKLANGTWNVVINLGDPSYAHDKMSVRAEGVTLTESTNTAPGQYPYVRGTVDVKDGELNIQFSDKGGSDPNWSVTRISLSLSKYAQESDSGSGQLIAQHSGKCARVLNASESNGTPVRQHNCQAVEHELFSLIPLDNGAYNVVADHSGKCLNVRGGRQTNGELVIQWPCVGRSNPNSEWKINAVGSGHQLIAVHSGKCLTVHGGRSNNGDKLVQWPCRGESALNQVFTVEALDLDRGGNPESGSLMAWHSGKCARVQDASESTGTLIKQHNCQGVEHERFSLNLLDNGAYNVVADHSGKCLNVRGGRQTNGELVIQWPCVGRSNPNSEWRIKKVGLGHQLTAVHSGKCLTVHGGRQYNGDNLVQWPCREGALNQIFTVGALGHDNGGSWSKPIALPLVPAAGGILPNGEVLLWSSWKKNFYGGDGKYTQTARYNPETGAVTSKEVSNTGHDMFCPGTSQLADGRIMVTGGSSSSSVSIFDPVNLTWSKAPQMLKARGYHSSVTLGNGSVLAIGGSWSGSVGDKGAELFDGVGWRALSGLSTIPLLGADPGGIYRGDNHMWLFSWSNNQVFQAGPSKRMHMLETSGNGQVVAKGTRGNDEYAINGSALMYDTGKILTTGGAPAYVLANATNNANVITISGSNTVASKAIEPMQHPRTFHHSVVLPSGEVLVLGGQRFARTSTDIQAVLAPEMFDPKTNKFTPMAPMKIPRAYHSFAVLLHDGRVLAGGGGMCGGCESNHPSAEIFTPPYLLDSNGVELERPDILQAPRQVGFGTRANVKTDRKISTFALVRSATATHSVNTDQRRIPVAFSAGAGLNYSLQIPADRGIAPPGEYMLFAMDDEGIPSVAKPVRIR